MEQQISELVRMVADLTGSNEAILQKVEEIGLAVKGLTDWRPVVEQSVDDLKGEIQQMKEQLGRLEQGQHELSEDDKKGVETILKGFGPHAPQPPLETPLLPTPPKSWRLDAYKTTAKGGVDGPIGHRNLQNTRGSGIGDEFSPILTPTNGIYALSS